MGFPFYKQLDAMDCGPACLRMICKYYGKSFSLQNLREKSFITREGVSLLGISDAAESIGMRTQGVQLSWKQLAKEVKLPCIVHWQQKHFVVVYKIKKGFVYVADPAYGLIKYSRREFLQNWLSASSGRQKMGIALMLEPTPAFYQQDDDKTKTKKLFFLFSYLSSYKKYIVQLILGMLLGSLLQLIFPFLTQSIVDIGINNQDISFIKLILIAQLVLFISRMFVEFIRGWILLHVTTRVNIALISDFLIKLMNLPFRFFDSRMIGDILQRIGDHSRIQSFLTSHSLEFLFSFINFIVFSIVLAVYSWTILLVFIGGTILYIGWVLLFMKRRKELDYKRFSQLSDHQSTLIQLISGVHEIKLNNCEKQKRWTWERIQAKLFRISLSSLALRQYQQAGAVFFNEGKNILITFIAATSVVHGEITLGMMLAIAYILGQLNHPVSQLISFIHAWQDARISLERISEVHEKDDEEHMNKSGLLRLPDKKNISIKGLTFQYEGPHSEKVLEEIALEIPEKQVTAIVGASGSGKSTLLKLILGFYKPVAGEIRIGNALLSSLSIKMWRNHCGAVLQEGFIFSDSIAGNIAFGDENIDRNKMYRATEIANIRDFIESLPLGFNTRIGSEGMGISQGQKQRILIARAVYKNPDFLFFDEATNALDAENERVIISNLEKFYQGRTVVIVAHRLSTVRNADQIIVLEKGKIPETGNHQELISMKGLYYRLIKNQLELGN
jgi:ATP-binding cassette, subfamily B, bacterial